MRIHRSAVGVVVQAPAKLNLLFEVLAKRQDGYHEIETLMCPIDWYDTLYFQKERSEQVTLECRWGARPAPGGTGFDELPRGRDNLVVRAVELLRKHAGIGQGAVLRLVKRIPMAAGLGGGSSDAAAALVAANEVWRLGWPLADLSRVAAELGSDVPFFLAGGAAICRGRGERVEPVSGLGTLHFVVVCPPAGLSTKAVYAVCRPSAHPKHAAPLLDALHRGDLAGAGRLLCNGLQPAAETLSPWIGQLRDEFARQDCPGHLMSGSGTSYFGLCRHARHARHVAGRFVANGVRSVLVVRSCR